MNAPNGPPRGPAYSGPNRADSVFASRTLLNAASRPLPESPVQPQEESATQNGPQGLPTGDTNAADFLAAQAQAKIKPNPLPISSLRTGFCYDIRMRFHQTVDYRDIHPEDPRRIYRIYKELALAGLIEDRETLSVNPDELMMRLRCRYATEDEILLVHSQEHLDEMKATESIRLAPVTRD